MNPLFPDLSSRRSVDDALTIALAMTNEQVQKGSVVPTFDLATFRQQLAAYDFAEAKSLGSILEWTTQQMAHGLVHVNHRRYFGLFNPTPTFPAQCADRIIASFNPQLATWTSSPAGVEIENHVIRALAKRAGFVEEARGHFTSGGSEANYTSVILALTHACPRYADRGVLAFKGQPCIYVSKDCHLAWLKIAHQAGIGREAVRLIKTDGTGRMDCVALVDSMTADRLAGAVPLMIVATAGTTAAGMIDPLEKCAAIARQHKLWFHIDAAWGGGLLATEGVSRSRLAGIEQADSVTIDAHKWFATTMGCGIFITQKPVVLADAFYALNSYMPSNILELDPYVTSAQWSRRFMGLRLFLSLAVAGWDGYRKHVEHSLTLIDLLKEELAMSGWQTVNASFVGVLCVVPPGPEQPLRPIVDHVLASGRAWISTAMFEGREVIRMCVTSGLTTREDIFDLIAALKEANRVITSNQTQE